MSFEENLTEIKTKTTFLRMALGWKSWFCTLDNCLMCKATFSGSCGKIHVFSQGNTLFSHYLNSVLFDNFAGFFGHVPQQNFYFLFQILMIPYIKFCRFDVHMMISKSFLRSILIVNSDSSNVLLSKQVFPCTGHVESVLIEAPL